MLSTTKPKGPKVRILVTTCEELTRCSGCYEWIKPNQIMYVRTVEGEEPEERCQPCGREDAEDD
jgi:hypothetical protein